MKGLRNFIDPQGILGNPKQYLSKLNNLNQLGIGTCVFPMEVVQIVNYWTWMKKNVTLTPKPTIMHRWKCVFYMGCIQFYQTLNLRVKAAVHWSSCLSSVQWQFTHNQGQFLFHSHHHMVA